MPQSTPLAVAREAMRGHKGWPALMDLAGPRKNYDVIICRAGGLWAWEQPISCQGNRHHKYRRDREGAALRR